MSKEEEEMDINEAMNTDIDETLTDLGIDPDDGVDESEPVEVDDSEVKKPKQETNDTGRIRGGLGKVKKGVIGAVKKPFSPFSKWSVIGGIIFFVVLAGGASLLPLAITALLGVALAGLIAGLAGRLTYAETALAGGITTIAYLAGSVDTLSSILPVEGLASLGIITVVGIAISMITLYMGRDIRDGLTRDEY